MESSVNGTSLGGGNGTSFGGGNGTSLGGGNGTSFGGGNGTSFGGGNGTSFGGNMTSLEHVTQLGMSARTGLIGVVGGVGESSLGVVGMGVEGHHEEEEEEARVLWLSYGLVVPMVVTAGLLLNGTGLYLLTRPAMKTRSGNAYLVVLVVCDLLTLSASIPTALTLNGCHLTSYNTALYFAHTFFTAFYILQTYTLYIILWISYDRFLALWAWERFHRAQGRGSLWLRLSLTLLLCVGVHVRHLVDVQVVCWKWVRDHWRPDLAASVSGGGCEGGMWVLQDGLHQEGREKMWAEEVWWVLRGLVVLAVPISLVLIFNAGIIFGMVTRRLHNNAATATTRRHALSSIYITLGVSGTFLTCTLPICLHAILFAANIKHCHGPYSEEVFRGVANILLLLEHLTHVPLLAFNLTFRAEAKKLFNNLRILAQKVVTRVQHSLPLPCPCCSCCLPCPWPCTLLQAHKEAETSAHPAAEEIRSPPQLTVSPPENTDGEAGKPGGTRGGGGGGGAGDDTVAVAVEGSIEREHQSPYHIPLKCLSFPGDGEGDGDGDGEGDGVGQDKSGTQSNGLQQLGKKLSGGDGGSGGDGDDGGGDSDGVGNGEGHRSSNHHHHYYLSPPVTSDPPSRSSTVTVIDEDV
ncbi:hypothetical protein Pcinc_024336 [Petrolisthes cinctipes]|uniref:G-protein coupled receptors family 1 profile domain-containing protein n=1 Tax=Petrolisthes cinctipes TaxID=88211 RepID=A0AAE1FAT8_PETCI|nr:hypothetical protein Pcinc_024336 [Petrolisthes cinctipes]